MSVTSRDIQKARRVALRKRSSSACIPCKISKTKCRDYRPCSRCKNHSQAHLCLDEGIESKNVDDLHDSMKGPLYRAKKLMAAVSRKKLLANQNYSFCPKIFGINESNHLLNQLSKFLWQRGNRLSDINDVLGKLPEQVVKALVKGLCQMTDKSAHISTPTLIEDHASNHFKQVASGPPGCETELSDDFWATVEYCGYLRCTYEPGTLKRTGLFMNEAFARHSGLDRAEMTKRLLFRDMSITDEVGWFCGVVEDLARPDRAGDSSRFVRLAVDAAAVEGGGAMLATESTRRVVDGEGRLKEVHVYLTPASRDDYDDMLHVAPHLCRPLAAVMGDLRSAAQCLADHAGDCAGGVAALMNTQAGRSAAGRLAEAVARQFAAGAAGGGRRAVRLEDGSLF